jgi:rare lipoprotein A (peptidoglycan hydrolase)
VKRYRIGIVLSMLWLLWLPCKGQVEQGKASYYAEKFKGRRTACGEPYHPDSLTCAHRTHPFGTVLEVYCPSQGTTVRVRVNDRGPFGKGRVVDLSTAAARKLGIILAGVAEVQLRVATPELQVPIFPAPVVIETLTIRHAVISPSHFPIKPPILNPQPPKPAMAHSSHATKGHHAKKSKGRK